MSASSVSGRLQASRKAIMNAIAGMTEQEFRARPLPQDVLGRPAPDPPAGAPISSFTHATSPEWSVADILAHLFIVETMLLSRRQPFDESEKDDPERALVRRMTVPQMIHGLVAQRRANLEKLGALEQQGKLTLDAMESFASHEKEHARQIARIRDQLPSSQPVGAPRT